MFEIKDLRLTSLLDSNHSPERIAATLMTFIESHWAGTSDWLESTSLWKPIVLSCNLGTEKHA